MRLLLALCLLYPVAAEAAYVPITGIPTPHPLIDTACPTSPSPWNAEVPGYYYVNGQTGTDTGRTYGSAAAPRATIPTVLPAGSLVELHGIYDHVHSIYESSKIVAQGTAESPVCIRGQDADTFPTIRHEFGMGGTYFINEWLLWANADPGCCQAQWSGPILWGVVRNSVITGTLVGGGSALLALGNNIAGMIFYQNLITLNGDWQATFDQDTHGLKISGDATGIISGVWFLNNVCTYNAGDCVQIDSGCVGDGTPTSCQDAKAIAAAQNTRFIFAGGNECAFLLQACIWGKFATDIVASHNYCHDLVPSTTHTSEGQCFGGQYATDYYWAIFNRCTRVDRCVQFSGYNGTAAANMGVAANNLIYDLNLTAAAPSVFGPCAIAWWEGAPTRVAFNNTIYNVESGICVARNFGNIYAVNNIIDTVAADGEHVWIQEPIPSTSGAIVSNLFVPNLRQIINGSASVTGPTVNTATVKIYASADFTNIGALDFSLLSSSPAINYNYVSVLAIYQSFQDRYGTTMQKTFNDQTRYVNLLDNGAYEYQGEPPPPPPPPPENPAIPGQNKFQLKRLTKHRGL